MSFYRFARMESGGVKLYVQGVMESSSYWWDIDGNPNTANSEGFRRALNEHEGEDLTVVIDSPGGSVDAGVAMYSMLKQRSGKTRAEVYNASSSATLVLCGCDKGERMISPAALVLIHNPSLLAAGDHRDLKRAQNYLEKLKEAVLNAYEEGTGLDRKTLAEMMDAETIFTAEEAVKNGFCDGVLETGDAAMIRGMTKAEISAATMAASEAALQAYLEKTQKAADDLTERERIALYASIELENRR